MAGARKKKRREAWNRFADAGRAVLVGAAVFLPQRGAGNRARLTAGASMLTIKAITQLLKKAMPERRPDGEDDKSFPSEHAAESTAAALIIEHDHPGKTGAMAYALAAAVSLSRVESKKHHPRDVMAGAVIGAASVWLTFRMRLALERRILAGWGAEIRD